ncbi:MAG: EAL domain-containing protein [bacterium]
MTKKNRIRKIKHTSKDNYKNYIFTYQENFEIIKKRLLEDGSLGIILIDASKISKIEQSYGKKIYEDILDTLKKTLIDMRGHQIRNDDFVVIDHQESDQFYVFLSKKRGEKKFQSGDLENLADRLTKYLNQTMFMTIFPLLKKSPKIKIGYAFTIYNSLVREERLIHKLIEEAKVMAQYQEFKIIMKNKEKLQELIIKEEIGTLFQPIVNIVSHEIIGYEALSRGPQDTEYESPYVLFTMAEETGLSFELDNICRKRALINAKGLGQYKKLFINILPASIHDPEFKGAYLKSFLKEINIDPHNVVLEISEKEAIENFNIFKKTSNYFKEIGFAIAIDDTGIGYSNFESLLELEPNYIKIDISMIHQIERNKLKQELVKAINQISSNMGSKVIAEGIETKEEMDVLLHLGVIYGQGFLFAKPAPPFPIVNFGE